MMALAVTIGYLLLATALMATAARIALVWHRLPLASVWLSIILLDLAILIVFAVLDLLAPRRDTVAAHLAIVASLLLVTLGPVFARRGVR